MNRLYLLDTHILLWWLSEPDKISVKISQVIASGDNTILVSAATFWELAIKINLGKLSLPISLDQLVSDCWDKDGFSALPITPEHTLQLAKLPPLHRDPFDRILAAQAIAEKATLISNDLILARYDLPLLRSTGPH